MKIMLASVDPVAIEPVRVYGVVTDCQTLSALQHMPIVDKSPGDGWTLPSKGLACPATAAIWLRRAPGR
ncbi:MAG: hypothetical protein IAE81_21185 [Caldilineaceae bacterium]|jgi:hypothetical protein|nr:hypothetical protein [Caldilineaceae bacterium]